MKSIMIIGGSSDIAKACHDYLKMKYRCHSLDTLHCDATNEQEVATLIKYLECDIVINFAGTIYTHSIKDSDSKLWERDIKVDLLSNYYLLKHNPKKSIIIGSSAARSRNPNWSSYSVAKTGTLALVETALKENIDVHLLNIGRTNTKMRHNLFPNEDPSTLLQPSDITTIIENIIEGIESRRVLWINKKDQEVEIV